MTFEITEGASNADIRRHIRELDRKLARGIRQGFFKVGSLLKTTAREQMMEKPKHGRLYRIKRGSRIKNHMASASGETPANVSGALRKSIGFEPSGMILVFGAGGRDSGVDYADYLESGTSKMFPRPLLQNAVHKQQGAIMPMMQEAVGREINLIQGS
jgi:hypothetical protein